ncbi:hypothetical protein C1646_763282 [Rhizophagus diaphanus]|nr:hypothetical protein C1646_763282 [Rhizophagus diaphanus] [Rhizophagus sp. MUCL 43196]
MVNNNTLTKESLDQLYEVFLYKKKDIIAIQKKLGINAKTNQEAVRQSKEEITLADSYEMLLNLLGGRYVTNTGETQHQRQFHSREEDIIAIGYTNQEMAEEADKTAREYLHKFEDFHGPLEDVPNILI